MGLVWTASGTFGYSYLFCVDSLLLSLFIHPAAAVAGGRGSLELGSPCDGHAMIEEDLFWCWDSGFSPSNIISISITTWGILGSPSRLPEG